MDYRPENPVGGWGLGLDVRRKVLQVPSPVAGADWSTQVPGNEDWTVLRLVAILTASAAVGNRTIRLEVTDGTLRVASYQPSQVVAASAVARCTLVPGGPAGANTQGSGVQWGGPDPFALPRGYVLLVSTSGIDVADQWSGIALDLLVNVHYGQRAAQDYRAWREAERARLAGLPPLSV